MERPHFPCDAIPADPARTRLLGLYPQRQEGLWMQRTKLLGGRLNADQWRALALAARRLTPRTPLHLTTRQDVELHDLAPDAVPQLQHALADAGLSSVGACGDTPRNITLCPGSGTRPDAPDLAPLARDAQAILEQADGIWALPRKFKISFSACADACAQPWINDLGFVALRRGEPWGFRVMAGGSLGSVPRTAMLFDDFLPADDALPLISASVRFFAAHGDRTNRRRARLRHVREKMGDQPFADALRRSLDEARRERSWTGASFPPSPAGLEARLFLTFPNGDVAPDQADALAHLADAGLAVRIANQHRVVVFGPDEATVREAVTRLPVLAPTAKPQPTVVACPGTRWCQAALADTRGLADRIRERFAHALDPQTTVCVSGCPNGCAQSAVAGVGLVGGLATCDGQRTEVYNLLAGGQMGRTPKLAAILARRLDADQVLAAVAQRLEPNAPPCLP
jgi:sulfite reductase beta subunit-like hemoprotein